MPPTAAATHEAQTFAPPPGGTIATLEGRLSRVLTASEPYEPSAPAAVAYRLALRQFGADALAAGGPQALAYLARRLVEAEPGRAEAREAILRAAWAGLPGWQP